MIDFFLDNPNFFAILLGAVIAVMGIAKQRETARNKNTLEFEAALEDDKDYSNHWRQVKALVANRETVPVTRWANDEAFDTPEAQAIRAVLNRWERAGNGVEKKLYNGDFLYDVYGTHVISMYDFLMPYVEDVRIERSPKLYVKFEKLAGDWKRKRQANR